MADEQKRLVDGQLDWSGGVNGSGVKTMASAVFPNGIKPTQLAWLVNGTVRGTGITQRTGWQPVVRGAKWSGLFQGAWMHQPDYADPHIVMAMGGHLWRGGGGRGEGGGGLSAAGWVAVPAPAAPSCFTPAGVVS